jgi:hypothetical protein
MQVLIASCLPLAIFASRCKFESSNRIILAILAPLPCWGVRVRFRRQAQAAAVQCPSFRVTPLLVDVKTHGSLERARSQ